MMLRIFISLLILAPNLAVAEFTDAHSRCISQANKFTAATFGVAGREFSAMDSNEALSQCRLAKTENSPHPIYDTVIARAFVFRKEYESAFLSAIEPAKAGYAPAIDKIAWMLSHGHYLPEDRDEAFRLYKIAADSGFPPAAYSVGNKYRLGSSVRKSMTNAVKYYEIGARGGHAESMFNLAVAYAIGEGVEKDEAHAASLLRKADELGAPKARSTLNQLLGYGDGSSNNSSLSDALNCYSSDVFTGINGIGSGC